MPTDTHRDETMIRVTSAEAAQSSGPDGSPVDTGAIVAAPSQVFTSSVTGRLHQ